MYQNVLTGIDGIGLYGVISIAIFFSFFTGMLIWAFRQKPNHLNRMAELPLEGGEMHSTAKIQSPSL